MSNDKVKEVVVAKLLEAMESGTIPWRKPWKNSGFAPQNIAGRKYRGLNWFILGLMPYALPVYLTFNQAKKMGGTVKKGEKGIPVVFWKMLVKEEDGEKKTIPMLRYYTVFNISQCEGVALPKRYQVAPVQTFNPIEKAEAIWASYPNQPTVKHGGDRACYIPKLDEINMPTKEQFMSSEEYYSTLFHEGTHATGHKSRVGRKEIEQVGIFGSMDYSLEELVAEMGSAMLCAEAGIDQPVLENQAAYLKSWYSKLSSDPGMLITAAARAQKATDYILNRAEEKESEDEEQAQGAA